MNSNRRNFLKKGATASAALGAPVLYAQAQRGESSSAGNAAGDRSARNTHTHDGIYYFPGLGANRSIDLHREILLESLAAQDLLSLGLHEILQPRHELV